MQTHNDCNSYIPIAGDSTLTISCDDVIDALYLDGVLTSVANPADWTQVGSVNVPAGTNKIAVKCTDTGVSPGLMASSTWGLITDGSGSWRCTNTLEAGWMTESFSDYHWPTALVKGNNGDSPRNTVLPGMSAAKWIWSSAGIGTTVYCRATF